MAETPCFGHFPIAKHDPKGYAAFRVGLRAVQLAIRGPYEEIGTIMDERVQTSCWGITAKAVVGFAGILFLAWLVGGAETSTVLAGAS